MPHGTCFLWYPEILYTQAISDVVTGVSYYSVAIGLIYFVTQREDIPFKWFYIPFGTLVFAACGTVHFLGAWTLWTPDFGVQTVFKVITAIVSLSIGTMLWPLMPKIIALPSPRQFAAAKLELADAKLQHAEKAVIESEQRFRDFAENGADWFWEIGPDLCFTYVAGNVEKILGLKAEQFIGKNRIEINQEYNLKHSAEWTELLAIIDDRLPFSDFKYHWNRPDGGNRYISISGKPRYDENNFFMGYRGVGRDITEQNQLEEQMRRAQKMEAVGQLTGGIAHDFNNILGIIQGNLEIIEEITSENPEVQKRIEKLQHGVNRGADITKKLLGFSRKTEHEIQLTHPNELVRNLKDLIAKSLTASIDIETDLEENLWAVKLDAGDLENALLNLALNARDAMPEGGVLKIETENTKLGAEYLPAEIEGKPGEYVVISVSDTGTGMDARTKDKILQPFFTTKERGMGTGLGLSMVYGFIQRTSGFLKIRSELGNGTTFQLHLPRSVIGKIETEDNADFASELPTGSEKILIVDDEDELREIAEFHLTKLGYDTVLAKNGMTALEILRKNPDIDLLFSDIILPQGMDGYQLSEAAREKHPNLKILLSSGFTKTREDKLKGTNIFFKILTKNILDKPYDFHDL
ncbi:MAG: response regulator, partial [Sneathiella sp.]|nr:response regulator [Sneathiella sp.]